jgi:AcrR family transcriptional regulator
MASSARRKSKPRVPQKSLTTTKPRVPRQVLRLPHGEGREALLQAVVRSVVRHGRRGMSNRAIAKEAGVSHGLIRYHFGSREEMLTETYKYVLDSALGGLGVRADSGWLSEWSSNMSSMSDDEAAVHLFMNEMVLDASRSPERRQLLLPAFKKVFQAVEDALTASGIPTTPALVRLVFAALVGVTLQHLVFRSPRLTSESAHELARVLEALRKSTT